MPPTRNEPAGRFVCALAARLGWILVCLIVMCLAPFADAANDQQGGLICASSGDHFWFAVEAVPASKGFALCHAAKEATGAFYRPQSALTQLPVAMAAWNNRVWLVFESRDATSSSTQSRREVFTVEVKADQTLGGYVSVPPDRLDIEPPLPGDGRLLSFVGLPEGPVALLAAPSSQGKPRLLQLHSKTTGGWIDLDLPPDFTNSEMARLAVQGPDGDLSLLAPGPQDSQRAIKYDFVAEASPPQWRATAVDLNLSDVKATTNFAGQIVLAGFDRTRPSVDQIEFTALRPIGPIHLAAVPLPVGPWGLAGISDGLRLLERDPQGKITVRMIDPLTAEVSRPAAMIVQPISAARLWQMAVLVTIMLTALLLVFLIRPAKKEAVKLPSGAAIFPASQRALALAIDLVPAGLVTMFILRCSVSDLIKMPLLTAQFEQSLPYLMMAGLALVHTTLTELFAAKSLGKSMLGARIVTLEGLRPSRGRILLRSTLKAILLFIPPLAALALFNPHVQAIDDMAAGTVVVHDEDNAGTPD